MSLYGTDKLLFSSLPFPSILREPSIRFLHIHTSLLRFIYLERTCSPRPRNHFSHRNYTWPANLSIIQRGWLRAKARAPSFRLDIFLFLFLLPPSPPLSWVSLVDNWWTWISAKRDSLMNRSLRDNYFFERARMSFFFFFLTVWRKKETIKERSIAAWWFKLVGGVRNSSFETIMIMIIDCTKSGS